MELKDFVKNVLVDLVQAIEETRNESARDMRLSESKDNRTVEFDIAVSVEDDIKASGKAGIRVLEFLEGGGDYSKGTKNSTVSRIKFGVHVDNITKVEQDRINAQYVNERNNPVDFR